MYDVKKAGPQTPGSYSKICTFEGVATVAVCNVNKLFSWPVLAGGKNDNHTKVLQL